MIVSKDSNPNRQLYYLGARLLEVLPENEAVPFFDAYQSLKMKDDVSISLFTLAADWLFVLGAVELDNGALAKCS